MYIPPHRPCHLPFTQVCAGVREVSPILNFVGQYDLWVKSPFTRQVRGIEASYKSLILFQLSSTGSTTSTSQTVAMSMPTQQAEVTSKIHSLWACTLVKVYQSLVVPTHTTRCLSLINMTPPMWRINNLRCSHWTRNALLLSTSTEINTLWEQQSDSKYLQPRVSEQIYYISFCCKKSLHSNIYAI